MEPLFTFHAYKDVLRAFLAAHRKTWGVKSKLASALGIHSAYLSQVLGSEKHLSLEQLERFADFLQCTDPEKEYLLLLGQRDRAGTDSLRRFLDGQIQRLRDRHLDVVQRLGKKEEISAEDKLIYYSDWTYQAIHICLHIPGCQSVTEISQKLGLRESQVLDVLNFLTEKGLAVKKGNQYQSTAEWIRLSKKSPLIVQHHSQLRLKAIENIGLRQEADLHYSGYYSFSRSDFLRIKDLWLRSLKETQTIIEPSPSEEIYCLNLDLFSPSR